MLWYKHKETHRKLKAMAELIDQHLLDETMAVIIPKCYVRVEINMCMKQICLKA